MVQRVQCGHGLLRSEKNSCKRIKTNIFTSGIDGTFLASRGPRSEQMTRIQKVVVLSSIERPTGEHLGAVGRQRDELNIL